MPRPVNGLLHGFFEINENVFSCKNGQCGGKVLQKSSGNLERHLRVMHAEKYECYMQQKRCQAAQRSPSNIKISLEVNRRSIEVALVELFTKNGRPLCMLQDRAFKTIAQPLFNALNLNVNNHSIIDMIITYSKEIKNEIIKHVKGKLLSLKVDAATRRDLSVLGINVQYSKNNKITIKTLAIKELTTKHTSQYLKKIILDVLSDYEININQIITITTDNGANMLKTVSDLNDHLQNQSEEDEENEENNILPEDSLDDLVPSFMENNITSVRCSAHTLQLCVNDVLKITDVKTKIEKCRSVAKKMRSPNVMNILKNGRYKKPILDCATRWNSTFYMMERLLELKEIINSLSTGSKDLIICSEMWVFICEFINTLTPISRATEKLQAENLYYSDMYIILMDILFEIEALPPNNLKTLLKEALNKRKSMLFECDLFNAAVFLDPRIRITLNFEQISKAKQLVASIHKRISLLNDNCFITEQQEETLEDTINTSNTISQEPKTLTEYLQNIEPVSLDRTVLSISPIETDILMYERQPRLPINSKVSDYWSTQENALSSVANVILAIPSAQVSVERLFSAFKYIFSDQRSRLSPSNLEYILLVRVNGDFSYE